MVLLISPSGSALSAGLCLLIVIWTVSGTGHAACLKAAVVRNTTTLNLQLGANNADTGWDLGVEVAASYIPSGDDDDSLGASIARVKEIM